MQIESLSPIAGHGGPGNCRSISGAATRVKQKYDQIKDLLGREMLDQRFAGMKQAPENATDEDRQAVNEMLDDLNELLDKHSRGGKPPQDFQGFMARHGRHFPENPRNVEELLDSLAKRGGGPALPQQPEPQSSAPSWMRWPSRRSAHRS